MPTLANSAQNIAKPRLAVTDEMQAGLAPHGKHVVPHIQ